jgi:membrane-bound lytic murein transglycosylase B
LATQASARNRIAEADARLVELAADARRLDAEIIEVELVREREAARVEEARRSLQEVALDAYVQAGGSTRGDSPLDPRHIGDDLERDALAGSVRQHHAAELADATEALAEAEAQLASLEDQRAAVEVETTTTTESRAQAAAELAEAEARIPDERLAVDDAWRTAMVAGTEVPLVAVDAYYRAAVAVLFEDPSCGLRWEAIAGIGRVEGHHGSFGASELQPDGASTPHILGIALDGTRGTRVIVDSDGGALDGDPSIDRAVGPMQFIPSTWRRWATEGNGDGEADPHSLYDAARTAGVYLCQAGPGLDTDEGLLRSFFSYNRSAPYGQRVLSLTYEYDAIGL